MADIKEVTMDVTLDAGSGNHPEQEGGGGPKTRRRKAAGGGRRTRSGGLVSGDPVEVEKIPQLTNQVGGGGVSVSVSVKPVTPAPVSVPPVPVPTVTTSQAGGGAVNPKVVIAPPKKRPPKLLLVPGVKTAPRAAALQKTFKAHKVRVLIDNTAKTQRRRRQTLQTVEAMTEDQLRAAAVAARLSRRETVAKVPVDLLRQMLKDYRVMRGMLL